MNVRSFALLFLVLGAVLAAGCVSGGGESTTTAPPTTAAPTTAAPTTTAPPTTLPPTTAPPYVDIKEVGASDTNGGFKVTVLRVGYFTHPQYNTAGPLVTHFRVDLTVENTINAARSIYPNINCYIVDDTKKRWPVYFVGSPTGLSGEYAPRESRTGYIVFSEVPEDSSQLTFTIEIPTANLPVKVEIPFSYP